MAPQKAAAPDYSSAKDAKHLLDQIGETIQQQAHNAALGRSKSALQGHLTQAEFSNKDRVPTENPCDLDYKVHTNVTTNVINPCANRSPVRFSDESRSQCTHNRIKDSKSDIVGACAPYRRLHVCDQNLEQIRPEQITSTHNLLVDVCMAAKFEGQSITRDYPKYQAKYGDSPSQICTMLARSFADIGDIIRGKDLYLGNKKKNQTKTEREKLEEKLQSFFKNIHDKLDDSIKSNYNNDTTDFYQLREDWWALNRKDVWKALTCEAYGTYFRQTCGSGNWTKDNCRCAAGDVPTYFDYVPQYLRWFEEWAEDFCRKKKKKVENLEKSCRGEYQGADRYCSRNGYDCEKTIRKIELLRMGKGCTDCLYACNPYVDWIENQRKQFLKQKEKYETEISGGVSGSGSRRQKRGTTTTKYDGYEKKFYEKLKDNGNYSDVKNFLELLSKEKTCKEVQDTQGGTINFSEEHSGNSNVESQGTFYRSEYCQVCPDCGVKKVNNGNKWEEKHDSKECNIKLYKPKDNANPTDVTILKSGEGEKDIETKLKAFCAEKNGGGGSGSQKLYDPWKCYQPEELTKVGQEGVDDPEYEKDVQTGGGLCILKKENKSADEPADIQKTFNPFFYYWVAHMLKDSIHWRTKKLVKCLKNGKQTKCKNGCNNDCECFKRWVKQKETEWTNIKKHFYTQKDIPQGFTHDALLKYVLKLEFSKENSTEDAENNVSAREIDLINEMLKEDETESKAEEAEVGVTDNKKKNTIDWLIQHEEDEAELCLDNHPEEEKCADEDDDSDDDDHEEEVYVSNPCATPSGSYLSLANKVAYQMHHKAKTQLASRAGRSALKGDATKGEYNRQGKRSDLKGDKICNINTSYSNDSRGNNGEPCTGKDGSGVRMKIGTPWSNVEDKKTTSYKDFYLPPRREHMCTSNLENLDLSKEGLSNSSIASNSLLGDVQLAAKTDAAEIINRYKNQNNIQDVTDPNDQATVCRAVRNSFADLGDIIRGRDMWDKENGMNSLRGHLKIVFDHIYKSLKDKGNKKYDGDNDHIKLREDWWEANRYQVWNAMKCALKGEKINCGATPYDDYIPQRLRWMTEWAEWYCKEQSRLYKNLHEACMECKKKDKNCTNKSKECDTCTQACSEYKNKIRKWSDQLTKMDIKYRTLYLQAQTISGGTVLGDDDPDYQQVVDFLTPIHKESIAARNRVKRAAPGLTGDTSTTVTSPYNTAAGYIHQELPNVGCMKQEVFCNSDGKNTKYAFMDPPHGYGEACKCDTRDKKSEPPPKKEEPACEIVKKLFENEASKDYTDWCTQKYSGKNSYRSWDCRQSTFKKEHQGACMPPRRKYLYIHKLKNLNSDKTSTDIELRKAFIECAAIETFFLWNKYKEDKKREEKKETDGEILFFLQVKQQSSDERAQTDLESGQIPDDFKSQMFYTFCDYRDIFFGNDIGNDMGEVQNKIKNVFPNSGKKTGQSSTEDLTKWWNEYGSDIWEGMVCGLSHHIKNKDKDEVQKKINKEYDYKIVKFPSNSGPNSGIPLSEFVTRPQFFRWLQEWGEEFCQKRKIKIDKIENECRSGKPGKTYCSGDGYDCEKIKPENYENISDLDCRDCHKQCKKYRKWIDIKFVEFQKQKDKYKGEHGKLTNGDNSNGGGDNNCCKEIHNRSTAPDFLAALKHCKDDQTDGEKDEDYDKNKIDFSNPQKMFNPSTYCKACPIYGVNCGVKGGCITNREKNLTHQGGESTYIDILINDGATKETNNELQEKCKDYGLYKNLREQKWKCQKMSDGVHECSLNNADKSAKFVDSTYYDEKIPFNILFERWLIDFIQYYNKSKERINLCTKDGEKQCIQGCKGNCDCVEQWLKIKGTEWEIIKEYYKKQQNPYKHDVAYRVKTFLQQEPFESDYKKAQEVVTHEKGKDELWGCTGDNIENRDKKTCEDGDFITNLISKLKQKIESCQRTHREPQAQCLPSIPDDEYEESPEDPSSPTPTSVVPGFCPQEPQPEPEPEPEQVLEPKADTDAIPEEAKKPPAKVPEVPKELPEKPRRPPREVTHSILPEMVSISAFPLSVGIAFAAFTYFYLKKKTKSSVGNLFQILQIPKSDYDIPTLKSSNRYIPYASDRYKGKTYIYMEGDSSGDEKYAFMSDTTDVTSSESEYEELDINDIYVPGSPKYKTLIEVVLEPSGKLSGNTIPTSGKNTPSDTQNDIQNDGIPSSKITDNEWNTLKHDFISQYIQSEQPNDIPNDYKSGDIPFNTQPNTLYFDKPDEKPFIMSIHDRNLYTGEEYSYNVNMVNSMDDPKYVSNNVYSGIDLINDSLNSGNQPIDIYDEVLKRKENELFGTNHPKRTSTYSVAKNTNSDPILNQINLFHTWLDRHRDMCEKWENHHERLAKLKEEWENETHSGDIHTSDSNKTLNTDVSIQIHMDNPKPINQFTNMDTILEDLEKYNEPYYDVQDDIYYDVNDHDTSTVDSNAMDVPSKVQIEMDVNTKLVKEKYPIADVWDI
ncbi:hypothetical protein PFDG_00259 [Plasmodium falciparum Dd2]|uniref:Erythrocyte membrane protein 1 n=1 Tax=Plasmodium falciparum (isolate Dd2) TaxID=57267 RepID=A0A0L7M5Y9_PLAF4|nr:hypothetical protein PFDG_00259 [Plasmodium falciparum Dd2]